MNPFALILAARWRKDFIQVSPWRTYSLFNPVLASLSATPPYKGAGGGGRTNAFRSWRALADIGEWANGNSPSCLALLLLEVGLDHTRKTVQPRSVSTSF